MINKAEERFALILLVKQILEQIDEIAVLKKQGHKAAISQELLKEMCSIIPELNDSQRSFYYEVFLKFSEQVDSRRIPSYNSEYADNSFKSKRKVLTKIKSDLRIAANS